MIRRAERKSYKWVGIAAAVLLLAAVLVFGLRIKEVSVSGSNRYTPEQIENILFSGRWGNNTILAFIRDKTQSSTIQRIGASDRPEEWAFSFAQVTIPLEASTWVTLAPASAAASVAPPV